MGYEKILRKESKPKLSSLIDDFKARKDTDFFRPTGTQVYCGRQGSGKTISAVKHIRKLRERYPRAVLCSNIAFTEYQEYTLKDYLSGDDLEEETFKLPYIKFDSIQELGECLVKINNGKYGVIYAVDEIHTYFNALDSKNIPMYIFTEISQQRKQRKLIIGTSQLFERMAKPFREQCDNLIVCKTYLGFFTKQSAYDGMSLDHDVSGNLTGTVKKTGWFYHDRELRESFDTFQKVVSGTEQYEQTQKIQITEQPKRNFLSK